MKLSTPKQALLSGKKKEKKIRKKNGRNVSLRKFLFQTAALEGGESKQALRNWGW